MAESRVSDESEYCDWRDDVLWYGTAPFSCDGYVRNDAGDGCP